MESSQVRRITLIVHDLSINPIARAIPIAKALAKSGCIVKIIGFQYGEEVYSPYQEEEISIIPIKSKNKNAAFLKDMFKLIRLVDGDVVYAFKPLTTTFFVGLICKYLKRVDLWLDIEDNELFHEYKSSAHKIHSLLFRGWNTPNCHRNLLILHRFTNRSKIITVVSSKLKNRYGGEILLHGPDENVFDPDNYSNDVKELRLRYHLPLNKYLVLFAGVPHRHKGFELLVEAFKKDSIISKKFHLVGAGPIHSNFDRALVELGDNFSYLGQIGYSGMPELLAAVDIVPILQQSNEFSEFQMPAKLFDAMAMGKLIIYTDVSDIRNLLSEQADVQGSGGVLLKSNSVNSVVEVLTDIASQGLKKTSKISENTRQIFLNQASLRVNVVKIKSILKL